MFPWNIFCITNEFDSMKLNFLTKIILNLDLTFEPTEKTALHSCKITYSSSRYSKSNVIALYASWMHIVSGFHFELRKTTTVTPSISLFGITSIIPASKIYRIVSTEKFSNISGQVFWSLKKFVTREWAFMSWLYKFQSSCGLICLRLTYSQTFVMLYFSTRRNRVRKLSSSRLCVTEGSDSWHKFRSSDTCSFKFTL